MKKEFKIFCEHVYINEFDKDKAKAFNRILIKLINSTINQTQN